MHYVELICFILNSFSFLGGSICVNTPIFFSRVNGLVTVSSSDQLVSDYMNISVMSPNTPIDSSFNEFATGNNLSIYNIDPEEILTAYKDTIGQLKAAFIFHIRNQQVIKFSFSNHA